MLGFSRCSQFCSHASATGKVLSFHGTRLECSHDTNQEINKNKIMIAQISKKYAQRRFVVGYVGVIP